MLSVWGGCVHRVLKMSNLYEGREEAKNIQRQSTCILRLQTQMPSCSGAQTSFVPNLLPQPRVFLALYCRSTALVFPGCQITLKSYCWKTMLDAVFADDDVDVVVKDCTCEQRTLRPIMVWPCTVLGTRTREAQR